MRRGRNATGATINVCEFGPGDPIGELEFLNNHKCVAARARASVVGGRGGVKGT